MKIIPKMLRGGKSPALFATFTPMLPAQPQLLAALLLAAPAASQSQQSGGITEKDLLSLLNKVDALPNERLLITAAISSVLLTAGAYSQIGMGGLGSITTQYALVMGLINDAKFNKQEYDKAYNMVVKNLGLNEIAINEDGSIYAFNKDKKLVNITIDEYLKNKSEYVPQTNSNLLWLRAKDPLFVDNQSILNTVSNGIGMKEVVSLINANLRTLGSSTEEVSGYVKKTGTQVESGIAALEQLANSGLKAAVDGIYKVKSKNTNSLKLMEAAIAAIYQSLTPNAQALLMLKGGDAKNPLKGAYNLISLKVMQIMNNTISYEETYDNNFNPDGTVKEKKGKGDGDGDDDKFKLNTAMMFLNGTGYTESVELRLGDNTSREVIAVTNVIPGSDNKPFTGKYLSELRESGMAGLLDLDNASMGGMKVQLQDQVLIKNTMHLLWWPAKNDGTPDLESADNEALRAANSEIARRQIDPSSAEALRILEQHGVTNYANLKLFVIIDGIASNKALGVDRFDSTPLLEIVPDNVADDYVNQYKYYWSSKDKGKKKLDFDKYEWWSLGDWKMFSSTYDDVYQGSVWIPVMNHWANAMAGTGERVKTEDVEKYNDRQANYDADIQALKQYVNPALYE